MEVVESGRSFNIMSFWQQNGYLTREAYQLPANDEKYLRARANNAPVLRQCGASMIILIR